MQRRRRRQSGLACYNLVEIVLALGVVAIGIVSIMGLFPVGLNANRDAVAQSYAADSADQLLHWYAVRTKNNWSYYTASDWLPDTKQDGTDAAGMETDSWAVQSTNMPNVRFEKHQSTNGLYRMTVSRGSGAADIVEFSGLYRMWQDAVECPVMSGMPVPIPATQAVAINLEVSWPAELPYSRRQQETYRLEIFNPQ